MNTNLSLIAEGNISAAVASYRNELRNNTRMNGIDENDIYEELSSPEFAAYLEITGLGEIVNDKYVA